MDDFKDFPKISDEVFEALKARFRAINSVTGAMPTAQRQFGEAAPRVIEQANEEE